MKAAAPRLSADNTAGAIYTALRHAGATPAGACGVLGNIEQECSFNNYEIETPSGNGYGLCQWSFGRRTEFLAAAKAADIDWRDLQFQIGFMLHEMQHGYPKTWRIVTTATDAYQAAIDFEHDYEGSNDSPAHIIANRAIPARRWYMRLAPQVPPHVAHLLHLAHTGAHLSDHELHQIHEWTQHGKVIP